MCMQSEHNRYMEARRLRMMSEVRDLGTGVHRHVVAFGTAGFLAKKHGEALGVYYPYSTRGSSWNLCLHL